ncbi:hypothetical protein ABMA28_014971 [Loxostege sticticalis]|uniref:Uncharacterized protein n=1 Tax=Loxostege sticticalis TaxID=481309 RepID=A0ABD0TDV3_LOXSC
MSTSYYDYYDGSKIFSFLSNKIGLPLDLVNFLIAQIAALCLARLFRKPLKFASTEFRHSVCLIIGLSMGYFCFGKQAIHISVLPMMTYILLRTTPQHLIGNIILTASMLYLSCLHLHRQIYHTADYTLDITGPLMVITQRVTSLAYTLQDSVANNEINSNSESKSSDVKVDKIPSPLEYFAFTLAFQTLMCGPVVFYTDYINFIEGPRVNENRGDTGAMLRALASESSMEISATTCDTGEPIATTSTWMDRIHCSAPNEEKAITMPSPRRAVIYKVAGSIAAAVLYLTLAKKYSLSVLEELSDPTSEVSRTWSALYLLWYAHLCVLVVRCKYYHAWLLSEAICNNCGMGFNGYDKDGQPKWDKMSNIDVFGFEFAQNFRMGLASWNKNTNAWLRSVAYERGGAAWRTARVYALSALWHGFHPGYYLTFFAGGIFTVAARRVRAVVRPLFLGSRPIKMFYDLVTLVTTRVAMTYATVPFVLLHLEPSLAFYGKLYYSLHFIAIGALFLPGNGKGSSSMESLSKTSTKTSESMPVANGESSNKLKIS